jgi:hypothetical protein
VSGGKADGDRTDHAVHGMGRTPDHDRHLPLALASRMSLATAISSSAIMPWRRTKPQLSASKPCSAWRLMQLCAQLLMQFSAQLDAFRGRERRVLTGDTGAYEQALPNTAHDDLGRIQRRVAVLISGAHNR